jgi:hypothetical protein
MEKQPRDHLVMYRDLSIRETERNIRSIDPLGDVLRLSNVCVLSYGNRSPVLVLDSLDSINRL